MFDFLGFMFGAFFALPEAVAQAASMAAAMQAANVQEQAARMELDVWIAAQRAQRPQSGREPQRASTQDPTGNRSA